MASQSAPVYAPISNIGGGNFSMISPQGSGATAINPNFDPNASSGPNSDPYIRGGAGYVFGGTNNVKFTWDGTLFNSSSDYTGITSVGNASIASTTTFFGALWTAHHVQLFAPGSYTFDTAIAGGNPESGILAMTVGTSQLGMHMLFDWNGNFNIDVVVVADSGVAFGAGIGLLANPGCASTAPASSLVNCLYDGGGYGTAGVPVASNPWMLVSVDQAGGDGIPGTPMAAGGPFQFFNANFNANLAPTLDPSPVPVPAAAWLFGSGLMGLAAVARRKKKA
jgi:hypothetical protein